MQSEDKCIMLGLCLVVLVGGRVQAAKSVFIISKHSSPSEAQAFIINNNQIEYQAQVGIDTYNQGYGAVANAIWANKELMFVTYENSAKIVWADAKSLAQEGFINLELDYGAYQLAGIVTDEGKRLDLGISSCYNKIILSSAKMLGIRETFESERSEL